jgi:hypothetical protein
MSDYVNFSLFILSFILAGLFWNQIFAPLRKNESFRNYLRASSLFRLFTKL